MDFVLNRLFFAPNNFPLLLARIDIRPCLLQCSSLLIGFASLGWRCVQSDIPVLVNHIALGMPMLIHAIPEDLYELLQYGCLTSVALLRELGRVVVMAVHAAFVLVVGVLGAKNGRTYRTGEVLDVVLSVQRGDV
jgi:hypothetical protein